MSMEIRQFSPNIVFISKWNSQRKYEFRRVEVQKIQNFTIFSQKTSQSVTQIQIFLGSWCSEGSNLWWLTGCYPNDEERIHMWKFYLATYLCINGKKKCFSFHFIPSYFKETNTWAHKLSKESLTITLHH